MKVLITDSEYASQDPEREILESAGLQLEVGQFRTEAELIPTVRDADAVITQYSGITENVIQAMDKCKAIIKYGIGINNIDARAATKKGIYVCNIPDYGVDEVSNHAIAFLFALERKLVKQSGDIKAGSWGYGQAAPIHRLKGSTLGLYGFGRMGQALAEKMRGFGLRLLAYDPYADKKKADELSVELTDYDTLFKESDFVSIHCPATEETEKSMGERAFDMMKASAYLINTSRGTILDENALIKALQSCQIAGAGLDVFETEPIGKDHPFLQMDNVILTGHTAWYSVESLDALQRKAALEAVNILKGNPPFNLCNPEVLSNGGLK